MKQEVRRALISHLVEQLLAPFVLKPFIHQFSCMYKGHPALETGEMTEDFSGRD